MLARDPTAGRRLRIRYHKADGTTVERDVIALGLAYKANPFYREARWLLCCWDLTRDAYREFDLAELEPAGGEEVRFDLK